MAITVYCKQCGKQMNAPESGAGKKGKCSACGAVVEIPLNSETAPPVLGLHAENPSTPHTPTPPATATAQGNVTTTPQPKKRGLLVVVGIVILAAIPFVVVFSIVISEHQGKIRETKALWDAGKKEEAVVRYKEIIRDDEAWTVARNCPEAFQRVIDAEAEAGDLDAAKKHIRLAIDNKVTLVLQSAKAKELAAEAEQQATKAKAEAEAKAVKTENSYSSWIGSSRYENETGMKADCNCLAPSTHFSIST